MSQLAETVRAALDKIEMAPEKKEHLVSQISARLAVAILRVRPQIVRLLELPEISLEARCSITNQIMGRFEHNVGIDEKATVLV